MSNPEEGRGKRDSFDRLKRHDGGGYSGMQIGRSHRWNYDQGEWRERKLSPDDWEIFYQTTKRRAAKAPKDSGAPVGTEYNWLILAHQRVEKLDENAYMTCMEGRKFKVAHKRASKDSWNASESAQRRRIIRYLREVIAELERADGADPLPFMVGEHDHVYGLTLRTKAELTDMARDLGISGTSRMKRGELLAVVKEGLAAKSAPEKNDAPAAEHKSRDGAQGKNGNGQMADDLKAKSRRDLYRLASKQNLPGRSEMNKAQLIHALQDRLIHGRPGAH